MEKYVATFIEMKCEIRIIKRILMYTNLSNWTWYVAQRESLCSEKLPKKSWNQYDMFYTWSMKFYRRMYQIVMLEIKKEEKSMGTLIYNLVYLGDENLPFLSLVFSLYPLMGSYNLTIKSKSFIDRINVSFFRGAKKYKGCMYIFESWYDTI